MSKQRVFKLSEPKSKAIRFYADRVDARKLSEDKKTIVLTITRAGQFYDPRYGEFNITKSMLLSMVKNFDANVYGQDIVLDVAHKPEHGSAGFFRRLFLDGSKLRGEVELTEYGIDAIKKKGFIYVSAEFRDDFIDNEKRLHHGPTLLGAGLTPRPVIKHLDRVQLSEEALDGAPMTLVSERIAKLLHEDKEMKKFKQALMAALGSLKLSEKVVNQLVTAFENAAKPLGDDEAQLKALSAQFEETGKQLAEQIGSQDIKLSIEVPAPAPAAAAPAEGDAKTLSEDDVKRILAEHAQKTAQAASDSAKKLADNQALFNTTLDEAESLKSLSEPVLANLKSAVDLITGDMTEDQVKSLAEHQIKLGSDLAVSQQLSQQGFQIQGNAHITVDDSNKVKSLQETIDNRLGFSDMSDSERYEKTGGQLQAKNKKLAEKVLEDFDRNHAVQLREESKMLSGGDGRISDVAFPAVVERTVIREALHQLIGLNYVNSGSMPFATAGTLPYSYRDKSAAGKNDTRIYEGQGIKRAGVIQTTDTVYPIPQKLAFEVSDELRYLTQNGQIDFNAVSENVMNASRIIGEDTDTLIFNEVLQSNDEFGAIDVSNEDIAGADIDGTNNVFVLANFPVARPRKRFDLKGVQIGSTLNPVVVQYNSGSGLTEISEYDGTGEQSSGTYYVMDYNLGEIYLTDESGVIVTPANTHAIRVSYSRVTNVYAFNTNNGATDIDVHWNNFLYRYGLRKTELSTGRLRTPNYGLMAETVMNQVEQAKQFIANYSKPGTDLSADGSLGRIKAVPNFHTTAPGLAMGDQRIVIGERANTRFRMMKPWAMGELQDQRDSNGRFTGQKEAYGDQFIVVHTPQPLKDATTSMVLFDSTTRVARTA